MFDGTTIKKILFLEDDPTLYSHKESLDDLAKHVEELKKTIESSKNFMRAIIEKVRYQGKIKIINELNNNPIHPEYQSSFPDLFHVTPKPDNQNNFYPFTRFDENFDLQGRKNISKIDQTFKQRMNKSIEESYYSNFINYDTWKVSDQSNSLENIRSTIGDFQKQYESLKEFNKLDEKFMNDSYPSLFIVNNNVIPQNNRINMIHDFKKIISSVELQKLISVYANKQFLYQSYLQLISEHPEIDEYQMNNSRNIYQINTLEDGAIKIVATNLSDLYAQNNTFIPKYKSIGTRATIVIPPNNLPIMKYSHFIKQ